MKSGHFSLKNNISNYMPGLFRIWGPSWGPRPLKSTCSRKKAAHFPIRRHAATETAQAARAYARGRTHARLFRVQVVSHAPLVLAAPACRVHCVGRVGMRRVESHFSRRARSVAAAQESFADPRYGRDGHDVQSETGPPAVAATADARLCCWWWALWWWWCAADDRCFESGPAPRSRLQDPASPAIGRAAM